MEKDFSLMKTLVMDDFNDYVNHLPLLDKMSFDVDGSHRRRSCGEDRGVGGRGRAINY